MMQGIRGMTIIGLYLLSVLPAGGQELSLVELVRPGQGLTLCGEAVPVDKADVGAV